MNDSNANINGNNNNNDNNNINDNNIIYNAKRDDIISCEFHQWYNKFTKITMKSIVVSLPLSFIQYLNEDGIILPESANHDINDQLSDDDDVKEVDSNIQTVPDFPDLINDINSAIKQLGGEVFIKLNWSAPIDATWINSGSMKCYNVSDIILLLKSSDRILFDLEHMFDLCDDNNNNKDNVTIFDSSSSSSSSSSSNSSSSSSSVNAILVIRKWANLNPSMEFRLFIVNNSLIGISQRDITTYYEFLYDDKGDIQDLLYDFFHDHIDANFPLQSYCIDVYIDKKKRVWIVDFNPFGNPTDALLFEWHELMHLSNDSTSELEMRTIQHRNECHASSKGTNRGPIDVTLAPDFYQFMKIAKEQKLNDTDD